MEKPQKPKREDMEFERSDKENGRRPKPSRGDRPRRRYRDNGDYNPDARNENDERGEGNWPGPEDRRPPRFGNGEGCGRCGGYGHFRGRHRRPSWRRNGYNNDGGDEDIGEDFWSRERSYGRRPPPPPGRRYYRGRE
ncbi:hypothetical protein Aperf_G00000132626 [Anoplocephala perfoliata]